MRRARLFRSPYRAGRPSTRPFPRLKYVDFDAAALEKFNNPKTANTILLGALSSGLPLPDEAWRGAIAECVKPAYAELNLHAFEYGRTL